MRAIGRSDYNMQHYSLMGQINRQEEDAIIARRLEEARALEMEFYNGRPATRAFAAVSDSVNPRKRTREDVEKECSTRVISVSGPSEMSNFEIKCSDDLSVYICYEFLQVYSTYFNNTLKKMTSSVTLPYPQKVVAHVLELALTNQFHPRFPGFMSADEFRMTFELADYLGFDYLEATLLDKLRYVASQGKTEWYIKVPQMRDILRFYIRENIVEIRNKDPLWPQLKEHIDDILKT
jgi:hypothetical protein